MKFKIKKYRGMEIHYTMSEYKYDVYDDEKRLCSSFNSLQACKEYIKQLIWTRANIPY